MSPMILRQSRRHVAKSTSGSGSGLGSDLSGESGAIMTIATVRRSVVRPGLSIQRQLAEDSNHPELLYRRRIPALNLLGLRANLPPATVRNTHEQYDTSASLANIFRSSHLPTKSRRIPKSRWKYMRLGDLRHQQPFILRRPHLRLTIILRHQQIGRLRRQHQPTRTRRQHMRVTPLRHHQLTRLRRKPLRLIILRHQFTGLHRQHMRVTPSHHHLPTTTRLRRQPWRLIVLRHQFTNLFHHLAVLPSRRKTDMFAETIFREEGSQN